MKLLSTNKDKNQGVIIVLSLVTWLVSIWVGSIVLNFWNAGWIIFAVLATWVILGVIAGVIMAGSEYLGIELANHYNKQYTDLAS